MLNSVQMLPHSSTSHALINMVHQWTKATDGTGASVCFRLPKSIRFDQPHHPN